MPTNLLPNGRLRGILLASALFLGAETLALAAGAPADSLFYLGGAGAERVLNVIELSNGTVLACGAADSMAWVPVGVPTTVLSTMAGNGVIDNSTSTSTQTAFILQLTPDLQQVLRVVTFPAGTVNEVRYLKTTSAPSTPTGDLFISGSRGARANGSNAGYYIAKLNGNFVGSAPTALTWCLNVNARPNSEYYEIQPWDVQSDGKVVYVTGREYDSNWTEVIRSKVLPPDTNGGGDTVKDVVPGWRAHQLSNATRFYGSAASYAGPQTIIWSRLLFKVTATTDTGLLRSFNATDYGTWQKDENGYWRRGKWPMDGFWNNYWKVPEGGSNNSYGADTRGYNGSWYRVSGVGSAGEGAPYTSRIGAVVIDKRNNHLYLGCNHKTTLPEGQPDFEPFFIAFDGDGTMKWWCRLYREYEDTGTTAPTTVDTAKVRVSTPDQYIDGAAIDYTVPLDAQGYSGVVYALARSHGNNTTNYWSGNSITAVPGSNSFHNGFTGTSGNIHIGWIGKLRDDGTKATLLAAAYCAEFSEGASSFASPYTDPNLDLWPSHNGGNANLNTTDLRQTCWVNQQGQLCIIGSGRRTVTTRNAHQRNLRPQVPGKVTSAASASQFTASSLVGANLIVSGGCKLTLGGQTRTVTAFDNATGGITLDTALPSVPALNTNFTVNEGVGAWNQFVRVYTSSLSSLIYSSLVVGSINAVDGSGGDNTEVTGLFPSSDGVIVTGWQKAASGVPVGNPLPVQRVPSWGGATPSGESGFLGRLHFSDATGYSNWAFTNSLVGMAAMEDADPDVDGRRNLVEYAVGSGPQQRNFAPAAIQGPGPQLSLTFNRKAYPDITYHIDASTVLDSWSRIWSSTGNANQEGAVTVDDSTVLGTPPSRFLRLRVSKP